MSKTKHYSVSFSGLLLGVLLLTLLVTGNCNACGCGPTRDYVGDYLDSRQSTTNPTTTTKAKQHDESN